MHEGARADMVRLQTQSLREHIETQARVLGELLKLLPDNDRRRLAQEALEECRGCASDALGGLL